MTRPETRVSCTRVQGRIGAPAAAARLAHLRIALIDALQKDVAQLREDLREVVQRLEVTARQLLRRARGRVHGGGEM